MRFERQQIIYSTQEIPFIYSVFSLPRNIPAGIQGLVIEADPEDEQYAYKVIFTYEDSPSEGLWVSEEMITDAL